MNSNNNQINDNYIFGLDIGTRSIVGLVGYKVNDDFNVIAYEMIEHDTRAMIDGQIHDISKVTETVKKIKSKLEKKIGAKLTKVCIAAAGRVLKTSTITVSQDIDSNEIISDDRVYSLELLGIERAHQQVNNELHKSDSAFYCVGYTVSRYYLNDYEIIKLQGHKGKKIGADIIATFLPLEVVESLYEVINNADMEVYSLTLEPIAAINVAIPEKFRLLNIALVDIGAGTSDIAITKDGGIVAYGMIPLAGDEITETIVHEYLVDFTTAETIKIKASGRSKTVSFKDIIGINHKIDTSEINKKIDKQVTNLANSIGEKIKELNGGSSTNAVFIVGGGGQVKRFTDKLAKKLGITKDRVALRGNEVLNSVYFEEKSVTKGPELVTPVGICYSGLENNKHDFIQVFLNDEPLRVFNNNNLTVMDVAALKGFDPQKLIPTRGKDLSFTFNGLEKRIKGSTGESARILVNNKDVSLTTHVVMNDYISIIPAKSGQDASLTTNRLIQEIAKSQVIINNNQYTVNPILTVNGKKVSLNYDIKNGDVIETIEPTLKEMLNQNNIAYDLDNILVNDKKEDINYIINNYDKIETNYIKKTNEEVIENEDSIIEEKEINKINNNYSINVLVNSKPITLKDKSEYIFVDIFDYIDFDLSESHGNVICKINNNTASYTENIKDGDVIEVYWSDLVNQT